MEVSQRVEGAVRGNITAETARGFLEQVCAANDLAWFFDGGVLHVSTREEMTQQSFELTDIDSQRLMADIEGSSVGDPMRSRLVDGGDTLQIWGMNAWVDDVARRVERLRQPAPSPSNDGGVICVSRQYYEGDMPPNDEQPEWEEVVMATVDGVNASNGNETLSLDQQQNFYQAVENAKVTDIVGQAVGSLAISH